MKIDLASDLTVAGTNIKVDSKAFKGEVCCIDFDMYRDYEYNQSGQPIEEVTRFCLKVTTEEMGDDHVMHKVEHRYEYEDGSSEEAVYDRKDVTPSIDDVAKDLAKKMLGKRSVL